MEQKKKFIVGNIYSREEVAELPEHPYVAIKAGELYRTTVPRWVSHSDEQRYMVCRAKSDMAASGVVFTPAIMSITPLPPVDQTAEESQETLEAPDSRKDTIRHRLMVCDFADRFCRKLMARAQRHDESKLHEPEKSKFDVVGTQKHLGRIEYGSKEYQDSLVALGDALKHHYDNNDHHPQHFDNGIDGMNLLQLVEMYLDWCAAVKRNKNGDIRNSIELNRKKFGMTEQLYRIFMNTVDKF